MPKPTKAVVAAKKEKKNKEAFEKMKEALAPGTSAAAISPVGSPEPEPEQDSESSPSPVPSLADQNKVEIKRVIKKVKALEHQIELAYEHSQWACPTEIMDGLARLEDNYGKFRSNVKISIAGAIEAQDSYAEILCVCFGDRCSVLYKLLRRNLHKEHRQVTREERASKLVKHDAPVLLELKAVSSLVCDLVNERSTPMTWSLSYRDGVRLIVDRCFYAIFYKLQGVLERPYSTEVTPAEFRSLVQSLEKDVKFLFGHSTPGATKLELLSKTFDEEGSSISKQKAFLLAREVFPCKKEIHAKEWRTLTKLRGLDKPKNFLFNLKFQ